MASGMMVEGKWTTHRNDQDQSGKFNLTPTTFRGHFKCNLRRVLDYPNLWNYLKDLYQRPEFKVTCNLDYTKRAYYMSMTEINPNRIVPKGPIIDFDEQHDRDRFGDA